MDLEFMIQCVIISTSKIFGIGQDLNEVEITALVRSAFADGIRVQLPSVLRWASLCEQIKDFFSVFRMEVPALMSTKTLNETEFIVYEKYMLSNGLDQSAFPPTDVVKFQGKRAHRLTQNRRAINFRAWLHTAL